GRAVRADLDLASRSTRGLRGRPDPDDLPDHTHAAPAGGVPVGGRGDRAVRRRRPALFILAAWRLPEGTGRTLLRARGALWRTRARLPRWPGPAPPGLAAREARSAHAQRPAPHRPEPG